MSAQEINALPVHALQNTSSMQQGSASASTEKHGNNDAVGSVNASEDELTCSICLEHVSVGELVRTLTCLHQFLANCIDPWLRQQGTCPVCKFKAGSGRAEYDAPYMV